MLGEIAVSPHSLRHESQCWLTGTQVRVNLVDKDNMASVCSSLSLVTAQTESGTSCSRGTSVAQKRLHHFTHMQGQKQRATGLRVNSGYQSQGSGEWKDGVPSPS